MNFPAGGRFVSTNGKQCDVDLIAVADFLESGKVSAVATVKNRAAIRSDHESAKIAMQVGEETGAPVVTRSERNFERPELDRLPVIELVHNAEAEIMHQVPYARRHDDRLIRRHAPQRPPIQVIEMGMRYQDKINRRQMMNFEAWLFQALDHFEPFRPDRVDQDVDLVGLDEK